MAAIKQGDEYSLKFSVVPGKDVLKSWFTFCCSDCYWHVSDVRLQPERLSACLFVWAELTAEKVPVKAATAHRPPDAKGHTFKRTMIHREKVSKHNSYNIILFLWDTFFCNQATVYVRCGKINDAEAWRGFIRLFPQLFGWAALLWTVLPHHHHLHQPLAGLPISQPHGGVVFILT